MPAADVNLQRARAKTALKTTDTELSRLQAAIVGGDAPESLVVGIRDRERTRKELLAELTSLDAGRAVLAAEPKVRSEALRLLDERRGLLGQHVSTSRQLLRKLLNQ